MSSGYCCRKGRRKTEKRMKGETRMHLVGATGGGPSTSLLHLCTGVPYAVHTEVVHRQ